MNSRQDAWNAAASASAAGGGGTPASRASIAYERTNSIPGMANAFGGYQTQGFAHPSQHQQSAAVAYLQLQQQQLRQQQLEQQQQQQQQQQLQQQQQRPDMSDFPSLGSPPGLVNMSASQQQHLAQQNQLYRATTASRSDVMQAHTGRPSLTPDDFPALSGSLGSSTALPATFGASADLAPGAGLADHALSLSAGADQSSGLPNGLETTSAYKPPTANLAKVAGSVGITHGPVEAADRFGMQGILSINDYGFDISKFGIPLPSAGAVYPTFGSPWTDQAQVYGLVEPDFKLPPCYNASQPQRAVTRVPSFADETLFYIFYTMPRDELQLAAAEELYRRQWRYHKELHLWLTKDPESQPTARTPRGEQNVFIFFDPGVWQKVKKEFLVLYEMLEDRGAALNTAGEPASASFRAGAQSVPPALQQYQGQGQVGMEQDTSGSAGAVAAAQAQLQSMLRLSGATASQQQQQQLMMLRQRQQQESAQAASRGMVGQMAYANAQMSEMNSSSMYNAAATSVRSMPPSHMEVPASSVAAQVSSSSSNLAEDVAAASMA